jgi:hypothetical protein
VEQVIELWAGPLDGLRLPVDPELGKRLELPLAGRPGWRALYVLRAAPRSLEAKGQGRAVFSRWVWAKVETL